MALPKEAIIRSSGKFVEKPAANESVWVYLYKVGDLQNPIAKYEVAARGASGGQTIFTYDITVIKDADYVYHYVYTNTRGTVTTAAKAISASAAPPEVTIIADGNNDGVVTAGELAAPANQQNAGTVRYGQGIDATTPPTQTVGVTVKVPVYAKSGDTIKMDNGSVELVKVQLTADDIANGVFTVRLPAMSGSGVDLTAKWFGQDGSTSLNGNDKAFINSDSAIVIDPVTADNVLNAAESAATVTVTGEVKGTLAKAGDTITLTINDKNYASTLDANKHFKINVAGSDLAANQQDSDGNGQPEILAAVVTKDPFGADLKIDGYRNYGVDIKVPNNGEKPLVEITTDANNDGFINRAEWQKGGEKIDVKVSFDKMTVDVGDTLVIRALGEERVFVLTAGDIQQGVVLTHFSTPPQGTNIVVEAQIADPAGNQSGIGMDTAKLDVSDLKKDGVKVEITEDANNDGYISATELKGDIDILITLPKDTQSGDKVFVDATGHATVAVELTQAQVDAGRIALAFKSPSDGVNFEVSAQVKDAAGNASNIDKDAAVIKTALPDKPMVTIIEDANKDGYINTNELQGDIDVSIGLPSTAKVGDTLAVSDNHGHGHKITLTADNVQTKHINVAFPAPANGETIKVTATITDPAGNAGLPGESSAVVDTTQYSGLGVTITTDADNDGYINQAELAGGKVAVAVTVPQGAAAGDTLTVTGSGNTAQIVVLTDAQIQAGTVTVQFNPTANGTDFVATALIKDVAGNGSGPVQDKARIQTAVPGEPTVTITEDANDDGWISAAELQGAIDVSVTLPATANAGDTVVLTDQSGKAQEVRLTLGMIQKGSVAFEVTNPGEGKEVKVDAYVRDVAGNPSKVATDEAKIDTKVPGNGTQAPVVTLVDDVDNNGYINAKEFKDPLNVKIDIALLNVEVGDVLAINANGTVTEIVLTAANIANGAVVTTIANPGEGQTAEVTALIRDSSGNQSATGRDVAMIDTQVKAGTLVLINFTDSVNPYLPGTDRDNHTNDKDYGLAVSDQEAGSTVQYQMKVGGIWIDTTAVQLGVADGDYTYRAKVTDQAGNVGYTNEIAVSVDATAPAKPTHMVVDYSQKFISGEAEAGAVVIVRDAVYQILGTGVADANGKFSIDLPKTFNVTGVLTATAMDRAGNESDAVEAGRHFKVYTVASSWNSDAGPADYGHFKTTAGDDWLQIGNGAKNCWTLLTQGNIWNKNPAKGWTVIDTGAGDDRIDTSVSSGKWWDNGGCGSMFAYTGVNMGIGNDTLNLKGSMVNDCWVNMGAGDDVVRIGGFMGINTEIRTEAGNDRIEIGGDMLIHSKILTDAGNDVINLKGNMLGGSLIDMGAGEDSMTQGGCMGTNAVVNMGDGNDRFEFKGAMLIGSKIDMGAGDDVVVFKGSTVDGKINGGMGNDTLILDYTQNNSLLNGILAWKNVTNISTTNITGFETVKLAGNNALDILYKDLLGDSSRDGALFVQGGGNSKVDLGGTDWNSDRDYNLRDAGGGSWAKAGSSVVGGVAYDVYHHSNAGTSLHNDVYIQQGIMVI